jgi:hypothetical protein
MSPGDLLLHREGCVCMRALDDSSSGRTRALTLIPGGYRRKPSVWHVPRGLGPSWGRRDAPPRRREWQSASADHEALSRRSGAPRGLRAPSGIEAHSRGPDIRGGGRRACRCSSVTWSRRVLRTRELSSVASTNWLGDVVEQPLGEPMAFGMICGAHSPPPVSSEAASAFTRGLGGRSRPIARRGPGRARRDLRHAACSGVFFGLPARLGAPETGLRASSTFGRPMRQVWRRCDLLRHEGD